MVPIERCDECGFDGSEWTDEGAIAEIRQLSSRFSESTQGLSSVAVSKRPIENMWSISEYVDHVRETLFGMRFVLDIAVQQSNTDLGPSPASEFNRAPKPVDLRAALHQLGDEAEQLAQALDALHSESWPAIVRFDDEDHDAHWICRHAVHDATHHLLDLDRLKQASPNGSPS